MTRHREIREILYLIEKKSGAVKQKYLIRGWLYQWIWPRLNRIRPVRHPYQKIEKELKAKPDWPKMGSKDTSKRNLDEKGSIILGPINK